MQATDAGNTSLSDPVTWLNFGVLGLILVGSLTGWIWFKPWIDRRDEDFKRVIEERDKALDQRDAMAQVLQDKLLPVVGDFITTTKALLPILQDVIHEFEDRRGDSGDQRPQPRRHR